MKPALRCKNVLVLYAELMGYGEATFDAVAGLSETRVTVVQRDEGRKRSYQPDGRESLRILRRSEFDEGALVQLYRELAPKLIFISGWMDSEYLTVAKRARADGVPVVSGLDNQWTGSIRQRLACLAAAFKVRPYFSHIQVAGPRQYEFARRLGYSPEKILFNLYSADSKVFAGEDHRRYPRRLLYVGRFHKNKGLDILARAWSQVCDETDWELVAVGSGDDDGGLGSLPRVTLKRFLPPEAVAQEAANAGAFVLPSLWEAWGVVIHEMALSGLPLVLSSECGALTEFLISNYNGFSFESENADHLAECLKGLFLLSEEELHSMGRRSRNLAGRISSETAAANLVSVLKNER